MSYSILVVDDDPLNLKLARKILIIAGYDVMAAARGEEAIAMACAHHLDLILLDIRLPDIDGLEVLRRLRDLPHTKDVPIVAMTAQALPEEVDRFMAAGCDGFIQKPISLQGFRAEVQRHLTTAPARPRQS